MAKSPTIIVNFQAFGKQIVDRLRLEEKPVTREELQAKEDSRAAQDTQVRVDRRDTGKPGLGKSGEAYLRMDALIRDLVAGGYRLIDAYNQPRFRFVAGKNTGDKIGTIARLVFSCEERESEFEDPSDAESVIKELLIELERIVAPLCYVWKDTSPDGVPTTDTINVVVLNRDDERFTQTTPHDLRLRIEDGTYSTRPFVPGRSYMPIK